MRVGDPGGGARRSRGAFGGGAGGGGARRRGRPARAGRTAGCARGARRGAVAGGHRGAHRGRRAGGGRRSAASPGRRPVRGRRAARGGSDRCAWRGAVAARALRRAAGSGGRGIASGDWRRSSMPRRPVAGTSLVAALAGAPPHEAAATPGRWPSRRWSPRGTATTRRPTDWPRRRCGRTTAAAPSPTLTLARVADSAADTAVRSRALTAATARLGAAESDRRSAAAALAERARLEEAAGDPAAAAESWRASLAAEPTFLPAARALRIAAARTRRQRGDQRRLRDGGGLPAGAGASGARAAAVGGAGDGGRVRPSASARSASCARRWPSIRRTTRRSNGCARCSPSWTMRRRWRRRSPRGSRWRSIRSRSPRSGWRAPISWPGTLGDWGAAREELEAVLRRQPEHARALERLSELLWSREAWGEAGEIYLRARGGRARSGDVARDLPAPRRDLLEPRPRSQAGGGGVRTGALASTPTTWRRCARCRT